jgi:hypothetical protein
MNSASLTRRSGQAAAARLRALAAAFILLAAAAAQSAAQQPAQLRVGQPVTGTLRATDPTMIGGMGPFHVYRLDARKGDRLVLTLRSGAFDAFLGIMHPVGGIHEIVATDDDGGGGSDARLRWNVPRDGTYMIVAQALETGGSGGYTLSVDNAPPARPATPLPIRIGQTVRGTFTEESPLLEEEDGDILHDLYVFDGRAGQELVVTMESSDFDAVVSVGLLRDARIDSQASDDDGGEGTNARLRFRVPDDGRYGILAHAFDAGALGSYTLTLRELATPAPRPLPRGQDVTATLDSDGIDQWLVTGTAGERIRVRMRSDDFDAFLTLGRITAGDFVALTENDDESDASTHALIEFTLPAAGEYVVRASAFGSMGTGSYVLRLDR